METVQEQNSVAKEIQTAVQHSLVYGVGNVLAKAIGFLMLPIYTHYLSPADYGILEILDVSMSLFGMLLSMGMIAAVLRSYARAKSLEEKQNTVSTAFVFVAGTGLVVFCIGVAFIAPLSKMILGPNVPARYLLLSFTSFVLGFVAVLPRTYLRALEASGAFVAVDLGALVLLAVLNTIFLVLMKIGIIGILLSSAMVAALQVVWLSIWTLRKVGITFRGHLLREMLAFGLPLIFTNMAAFTLNFSDRFFLQRLRSLEIVGLYAVAYKFGFLLNYLLVQPFFVMWQSRMYAIHAQSDHKKMFGQFFMFYSLLLTYAGLVLSMFSPEIIKLLVGPKFSASQSVVPIVTFAYVLYGIGYYTQVGMFISNRTSLVGIIGAGSAILNLALNYVLIIHYGMLGAAWATLLSFLAMGAASYWFANRVYPLPLALGRASAAMLLGVGLYLCALRFSPSSLGLGLLLKTFLLAAFPVLLWKVRILSAEEMGTLASMRTSIMAGASRLLRMRSRKG